MPLCLDVKVNEQDVGVVAVSDDYDDDDALMMAVCIHNITVDLYLLYLKRIISSIKYKYMVLLIDQWRVCSTMSDELNWNTYLFSIIF